MTEQKPNPQLAEWSGDFGKAYTDRNPVDPAVRTPAFKTMLGGLGLKSALELGCNRGHNLTAIRNAVGQGCDLAGVEPNAHALSIARANNHDAAFIRGNIYDIPFKDSFFELAFTVGVLIHIPPESLPKALSEIHRVSSKYILAVEYFSDAEEEIEYRGRKSLLWKRDYKKVYLDAFPGLKLAGSGYWDKDNGFDRSHWWLLAKP